MPGENYGLVIYIGAPALLAVIGVIGAYVKYRSNRKKES